VITLAMCGALLASLAVDDSASAAAATCNGVRATIVGTAGSDYIVGTAGRDVIFAGGGNDVVLGKAGNDLICGGAGGDILNGLSGADVLYGGTALDECFGESNEHIHHYQCEIHRSELGNLVKPPPHSAANARPATTPTKAPDPPSRATGEVDSDRPACDSGVINLGRFFWKARYPAGGGWIAVQTAFVKWDQPGGGYSNAFVARDWQEYQVPVDGNWYYIDSGSFNTDGFPSNWGYNVWWWTGSSWVDGTTLTIPLYNNYFLGSAGFYTDGSCIT